ncbi:ParB/RepB/Spo0J family partition protein [Phascolarctobacterium succinatutens]|uniref:ParB/RepB/Spo0J family partition protein n=1 Tax=Phascolarctobacterium succinatutens TaxID=626940 RepID=UPI004025B617
MSVVNMPIEYLVPHPQNPRKDLGNLEELTASIKENGIYQNLTVIPINEEAPDEEPKYMVVIGHRRLEAAKRAGLQEVPCAIVRGLTETQQLQIMLLENMQRSDLTVYEQAQGFQQLLDFGMDIEDISQQSGFSKRTIRRRLEIAKLDQNKLKKLSSTRQLSLKEFDELAKIKNMEARNEVMEKIGTNDFALAVTRAMDKEKLAAAMPVFLADMERLGIKKFPDSANKYSGKYRRVGGLDLYEYEVTKDEIPKKTEGLYYEASYPRKVEFYVKETKKAKIIKKSAKELEKEKRIKEAWFKVDAMAATHYELRKAFVENLRGTAKQREAVYMGAYSLIVLRSVAYMSCGDISKEAGIDDKYFDNRRDEKAVKLAHESYDNIQQCIEIIYKLFNDNEKEFYANGYRAGYPEYKFNPRLEAMYHWLTKLGYQMSSEEKLIAAGTHEIFQQNIFEGGNK